MARDERATTSPADPSAELARALRTGVAPRFDPYTGVEMPEGPSGAPETGTGRGFRAAELGLEAPRYCQVCGRRMVVQVDPVGWTARCSRHGGITADTLGAR